MTPRRRAGRRRPPGGLRPSGGARPPASTQDRVDGAVAHVIAVVVGVVVAGCGTVVHRWEWLDLPAGLALGLLTVLVGAVFARAVARGTGLFLYLVAGFLTVQAITFLRPGGDVLVTTELVGYAWLLGQPVATLAALAAPRRWFAGPEAGA